MKIVWTSRAWEDYLFWQKTDKKKLKRINQLIKSCMRTPFSGIGKPEALKHELHGHWSRRIDDANRLVYAFSDDALTIVACRYHY